MEKITYVFLCTMKSFTQYSFYTVNAYIRLSFFGYHVKFYVPKYAEICYHSARRLSHCQMKNNWAHFLNIFEMTLSSFNSNVYVSRASVGLLDR